MSYYKAELINEKKDSQSFTNAKAVCDYQETERLATEVRNAISGNTVVPYLKLSLVPQEELQQKLPLSISPQPQSISRIHIMIKPLNTKQSLQPPLLTPLNRQGFTVTELGARFED